MKKRKDIGFLRLLTSALIASTLFLSGFALTTRYKETILNTYNKYFDKYYGMAMDYYSEIKTEIKKELQRAKENSI